MLQIENAVLHATSLKCDHAPKQAWWWQKGKKKHPLHLKTGNTNSVFNVISSESKYIVFRCASCAGNKTLSSDFLIF